jgi:hypothetical protein
MASFRDGAWAEAIAPFAGLPRLRDLLKEVTAPVPTTMTADGTPIFDQIAWLFGFGSQPAPASPGRWLRPAATRVEITEIRDPAQRYGLLLVSPEPLDPARTLLDLAYGYAWPGPFLHTPPGAAKVVAVEQGGADEHVDLVAFEDLDLAGWRIEHGAPPGPPSPATSYYEFQPGTFVRAGTVLRVHTLKGAIAGGPAYRHLDTNRKQTVLAAGDIRLRLVDAAGRVAHDREFPDPGRFDGLAPTFVWNADFTAAFVFVLDASLSPPAIRPLGDGLYRLHATHRRQLADPLAPRQRQRGDAADEPAALDFLLE